MSISTKVVFNRKTMEQVTESRRKPIVVGIGELLWDMLPSGKKAGGAPINFVYHASCLGAEDMLSALSEMMSWVKRSLMSWIRIISSI